MQIQPEVKSSPMPWVCFQPSILTYYPKVLFIAPIWPSDWWWWVLLKFKVVSKRLHNSFQKWLRNLTSIYEVKLLRTLWSFTIQLQNHITMWLPSLVFLHGTKCVVLDNISTTIIIESTRLWVTGNPSTKSRPRSSQIVLQTWRWL